MKKEIAELGSLLLDMGDDFKNQDLLGELRVFEKKLKVLAKK